MAFSHHRLGRLGKQAALLASTMMCVGFGNEAFAQQAATSATAPSATDENSVEVATGDFTPYVTDIAIGSAADGLAYTRYFSFTRASTSAITGNNYDLKLSIPQNGTVHATYRGTNYKFSAGGGAYSSTDGTGAALVYAGGDLYVLTLRDGTKVTYDAALRSYSITGSIPSYQASHFARGKLIQSPDGRSEAVSWVGSNYCSNTSANCATGTRSIDFRIQSVTNSAGYQLHFNYANDTANGTGSNLAWKGLKSIQAINTNIEPCAATAATCSLQQSWPTVDYSTAPYVTDSLGRSTVISGNGPNVTVQRVGGAAVNVTRNVEQNGQVTFVNKVTRAGSEWNYNYAVAGNVATLTRTDVLGGVKTFTSLLDKKLTTRIVDELGRTTSYAYDNLGRVTEVTHSDGGKTIYTYDARGNVTSTTRRAKPGSPLADIVTTAGYPASCSNPATCNRPTWTRDARQLQTDYGYDPVTGQPVSVTSPAASAGGTRPEVRYSYTVANGISLLTGISICRTLASCAGSTDEIKTVVGYDGNLRATVKTVSAGDGSLAQTTTSGYDRSGNLATVDGPLAGGGDTTQYRYDAVGQLIGEIGGDPDGSGPRPRLARRFGYNVDGNVTTTEIGTVAGLSDGDWTAFASTEVTTSEYDGDARKLKDNVSAGGVVYAVKQYSYDALGRIDCSTMRMNPASYSALPSACTQTAAGGSFGPDRITKTSYNAIGQATRVQSGYGTVDQIDETITTYLPDGLVATLTDAEGNRTSYEYDGFGRPVKMLFPSGSKGANASNALDYEEYGYDAASNIVSERQRDGSVTAFTYDNLGRVVLQDMAGTDSDVALQYDLLGHTLSSTRAGLNQALSYDALARLSGESQPFGSIAYQYDVAGRRSRMTWNDGFFVDYDYDNTDNMIAVRENGATSGVGVLASYTYDDLGRRASITRGNGATTTYGYDAISRLSSLVLDVGGSTDDLAISFTFNPAGQIISRTRSNTGYAWPHYYNVGRGYTANGLNQLTNAGGVTLTYDAKGNLAVSGSDSYGYTANNMVKSGPGGATLAWDAFNRLVELGKAGSTRFVYDGDHPATEIAVSSGAIERRYVFGAGADEPLVWYEGAGAADRRWLLADERGSIVAVTGASGAVIQRNSYDENGIPAGANIGRFQFTGQAWLPELGMYNYKARLYSPTLGRFMQADPIGYAAGMNLYAYVSGDPVNRIDPSGLAELCFDRYIPADSISSPSSKSEIVVTGGHYERTCVQMPDLDSASAVGTPQQDNAVNNAGKSQLKVFQVGDRIKCRGPARVMEGNHGNVGKPGGMLRNIRPGSISIIPRQFAGGGNAGRASATLRDESYSFYGETAGGQTFFGADDVVNHAAVADSAREAQDAIMARDPGMLIIELNSGSEEGRTTVTINVPGNVCPANTTPVDTK